MPIDLADVPAAVADYLETQVAITISKIKPRLGRNFGTGEEATCTLTVTNEGAAKLINVVYHLAISRPAVAKLEVPSSVIYVYRATTDKNDPQLSGGTLVGEMVIFPRESDEVSESYDNILEPGENQTFDLVLQGVNEGDAELTCHIHGTVDQGSLFPRGRSDHGDRALTVT
ncbi:MAG: hypothetical protein ACR2QK_15115 [Acidimicrobiales bacterium]